MKHVLTAFFSFLPFILLANSPLDASFKKLEDKYSGKIGVYSINNTDKSLIEYNENYHFPICSVFKLLLVGAVLHEDMQNEGFLDKKILITKKDITNLGYTPITGKNIGKHLTISQLSFAAILSDNAAGNILIEQIGGLNKLNLFIKNLGDENTIINNNEPKVNNTTPESNINKTTPKSITRDINELIFGNILDDKHKKIFIKWLQDNNTGKNRIALNAPKNWIIGDKTGTCGEYGSTNDVAILWSPNKKNSIALGILYTNPENKNAKNNEKIIQEATKLITNSI
ncbi:class A beta-lactamase [Francisella adeliensis]|uniref:Beta-lactamase n=1 Tax=Francisella adeliensis TaxID=2007306 RepID=A0A2Z4XY48_9GAMM|nr:class A beta-lactamase [Francisella adeliensis]AXA33548.1 class A beta-lactamase [Francisella adeliensis]MBK2084747.1 class A beta-lactamase [Francisella adeliensis]MBK2097310.1 class A beta-lactamase [Francisella adeliensis]QIW11780.1 class A beta-lactamase [Francisella adeliensis]QIW13656.1 class A beta-lactamase [Francisella adeliensis]